MILRTVTLLVSPQALPCSHVAPIYIECCSKGRINFSVDSGSFDRGHFAMCILLLSFSVPHPLWAFQQLMGFAFLFVYIIRNWRFNVLLQFNVIGSTQQRKCFHRRSILLEFVTLHDVVGVFIICFLERT